MIFEHTWQWILEPSPHTHELKRMTSRIAKPGDGWTRVLSVVVTGKNCQRVIQTVPSYNDLCPEGIYAVHRGKKVLYEVGKTYAVQPGRGKKTIEYHRREYDGAIEIHQRYISSVVAVWDKVRIRITGIKRYDVRHITDEEVKAEGFGDKHEFWSVWVEMHDKSFLDTYRYAADCDYLHEYGFYKRPAKRYDAWQLHFEMAELITDTIDRVSKKEIEHA